MYLLPGNSGRHRVRLCGSTLWSTQCAGTFSNLFTSTSLFFFNCGVNHKSLCTAHMYYRAWTRRRTAFMTISVESDTHGHQTAVTFVTKFCMYGTQPLPAQGNAVLARVQRGFWLTVYYSWQWLGKYCWRFSFLYGCICIMLSLAKIPVIIGL